MTKDEASKTVTESGLHVGGAVGFKAVEYDCPGGYAVVAPVEGHAGLWFVLTHYHVTIFEELQSIAAAPPIVRLAPSSVKRENAALREELRAQWEENHFEHCGRRWPHADGDPCMWPLPALLNSDQPR